VHQHPCAAPIKIAPSVLRRKGNKQLTHTPPPKKKRKRRRRGRRRRKRKKKIITKICKSDKIMLNQKLATEHFACDLHISPSASRD
jgi:hypothetical protein